MTKASQDQALDPWWFRFLKTRVGAAIASGVGVAGAFLIYTHPQVVTGWFGQSAPIQIQMPAAAVGGTYSSDQVRQMISDAADAGAVKSITIIQPQLNEIDRRLDDIVYGPKSGPQLALRNGRGQ